MVLSVSIVLLLGVTAFALCRVDGLKMSHLVVCVLFGFYLASTTLAPHIRQGAASVAALISDIKF